MVNNYEVKKSAIQLLALNNILSEEEVEKCLIAIDDDIDISDLKDLIDEDDWDSEDDDFDEDDENEFTKLARRNSSVVSKIVYSDENLVVSFKGAREISNLFFGDGIEFKVVVENKTSYSMRVSATQISLNGFIVSNDELICSDATANKKTIDCFHLYGSKLSDVDVETVNDIEELEFAIKYEIEELEIEKEGNAVIVEL